MVKRLVLVSLLAACMLPLVAAQDESFGDKVRQLLGEGTDLYKKGKYAEASGKFEEAFQLKPSSDQVYAFIKRAGEDMLGRMMNDPDRKIQDIARRLMEMAKPGEPSRRITMRDAAEAGPEVVVFMPCGYYLEDAEPEGDWLNDATRPLIHEIQPRDAARLLVRRVFDDSPFRRKFCCAAPAPAMT
jgi:hypothetical protein